MTSPRVDNRMVAEFSDAAHALHARTLVIDTHCDTTQRLLDPTWDFSQHHGFGHVDVPRLRRGNISAVVFAVFAMNDGDPSAMVEKAREQIIAIRRACERHGQAVALAESAADVRRIAQSGKIAVMIGIEGGHLIGGSLHVLEEFRANAALYLTLTHGDHNALCDSAGIHMDLTPRHHGLSSLGREVIREANRLGVIVDVSHVSDESCRQVLDVSSAPVIASHSSCRSVAAHRRNLPDELIRKIAQLGGSVQINFASLFIDPMHPVLQSQRIIDWFAAGMRTDQPLTEYRTPLKVLVDHVEHALNLVGPKHVGIGSDFDGVPAVPEGVEDCSQLPNLTAMLLQRGFGESELKPFLGENVLRVMEACGRA